MGGANQIITDKTGTLTTNEMTVTGVYTLDKKYIEPNDFCQLKFIDLPNREMMSESILYNCSAHVETNKITGKAIVVGNASE